MTRYHLRKAHIKPVCFGIDLLGYRVLSDHRRLRNDNGHRFARKLQRLATGYAQGRLVWDDINSTLSDYMIYLFQDRHSGMDCRYPGPMDGFEPTVVHGTGYPLPGGYDDLSINLTK